MNIWFKRFVAIVGNNKYEHGKCFVVRKDNKNYVLRITRPIMVERAPDRLAGYPYWSDEASMDAVVDEQEWNSMSTLAQLKLYLSFCGWDELQELIIDNPWDCPWCDGFLDIDGWLEEPSVYIGKSIAGQKLVRTVEPPRSEKRCVLSWYGLTSNPSWEKLPVASLDVTRTPLKGFKPQGEFMGTVCARDYDFQEIPERHN